MRYDNNLNSIVSIIRDGEKPARQLKVGAKFEHIIVEKDTFETVSYEEGIKSILLQLRLKGYQGIYEEEHLMGLEKEDRKITLGPGGQLEVSVKKCSTVKEIREIYFDFLKEIVPILDKNNRALMAIGYHPRSSVKEIPLSPKKQYQYILKCFRNRGNYLCNMLKGLASLEVYIDYTDEDDFIKKFRVANFISPFLHLISDNAPIFEGELFNKFNLKALIIENVCPRPYNYITSTSLNKSFGYRDYAEYILNLSPPLIEKEGQIIPTYDKTVRDLILDYNLSTRELSQIMKMIFSEVGVKDYIAIRVGDALPYPYNISYIALLKGLFYSDIAIQYLYDLSERVEYEKLNKLTAVIYDEGFDARIGPRKTYEIVRILFDLAKSSLSLEEKEMLAPLEKIMINKTNLSSLLKEKIKSEGIHGLRFCTLNEIIKNNPHDL